MKTVCFRVDFGSGIGFGHISRALPIARAVSRLGMRVLFLSRSHQGADSKLFSGFPIEFIGRGISCRADDHTNWLGVDQIQDANESMNFMPDNSAVYVDHYSLDSSWHRELKKKSFKVLSVDDFIVRHHSSDILLDYNVCAENSEYIFEGKKLFGLAYCPLNENFHKSTEKTRTVKSILIAPGACTEEALKEIVTSFVQSKTFNGALSVTIIHPHAEGIKLPGARLIKYTENMVQEYRTHDFVIGGCGFAFLERAFLEKPQICFQISDNQEPNSEFIKRSHPECFGGDLRKVAIIDLIQTFDRLTLLEPEKYIVTVEDLDGKGATRVAKELKEL